MIPMNKTIYCTLDTETVGGASTPSGTYNIGCTIHDRHGNIFATTNLLVMEHYEEIRNDDYAKRNFPIYAQRLASGEMSAVATEAEAVSIVSNLCHFYGVRYICAYNSAFDLRCRRLASKLIKNEQFRDQFLRRLAWHINEVWTSEHINAQIDVIEGAIAADMVKDCKRWGNSYSYWQERVEFLRGFSDLRTPKVIKQVKSFFNLTDAQLREYGFQV